ncbi:MAG: YvrJ family protein [Anaerococcus sp.]
MDLQDFIANMGFPIVVSLILILRTEEKIDKLTESIQGLMEEIKDLTKNIQE